MFLERGEGELEISNQGWSRVKSFSQETDAIGQQTPWNGDRPRLRSLVQDARDSLTYLPSFFSPKDKVPGAKKINLTPETSI